MMIGSSTSCGAVSEQTLARTGRPSTGSRPCSRVSVWRPSGVSRSCRVAGGGARCSRGPWSASLTSCCSTNRPTIWTSPPSSGWKRPWSRSAARCCSSPTIAPSSTAWPRAWSNSIADGSALGRGTMTSMCSARRCSSRSKPRPTPISTASSRKKRSGSARAWRRGAPATRAGCGRCKRCVVNDASDAIASGRRSSRSRRPRVRDAASSRRNTPRSPSMTVR